MDILDEYSGARMVDGIRRHPSAPIDPSLFGRNIKKSLYHSNRKYTESTAHQKWSIELMLDSLVSSTQAYLNTTIPLSNIVIAFPSRIYATEQGTTNLSEAFQNVNIGDIGGISIAHYMAIDELLTSFRSAARHSKPQQYTALVIDYSKEAFSTMVIESLDSMDHWQDIQVAQYNVDFHRGHNNATGDGHFLKIKQRLDELITLVGPRGKFFHLILMGDQASQEEFLSVADWVLHDRIERWDRKQLSTCVLRDSYDPAFIGAQTGAKISLTDQWWDEWDFYARRPLLITRPLSKLRHLWMEITLNVEAYSWALKRYFVPEPFIKAQRSIYLIGQ
jgi:hypothetical protein